MDIRFNNGPVAADVIGIDFFFSDHPCSEKLVERLPRFGLECEMGLIDELKTDRFFFVEASKSPGLTFVLYLIE